MTPLLPLLASADDACPALPHGLDVAALHTATRPRDGRWPDRSLGDPASDPNNLVRQRWGIVAPQGPAGERLLSLVPRLRAAREAAQHTEARVFRVPPDLDATAAVRWHRDTLLDEDLPELERPRFLLLLGDLQQISPETQQVLALDGFPGRLCFETDAEYQAYEDKVLTTEQRALLSPQLSWFTVHDGSEATLLGHSALMQPGLAATESARLTGDLPLASVISAGNPREPNPAELIAVGAESHLLVTLCHGLGAPREGWSSPEAQRERQGALAFGRGWTLEAGDLSNTPFVPSGFWLHISCFGLGTPARSAYRHWLKRLAESDPALSALTQSQPPPGAPGFVSRVAQSALSNPHGPLAMVGHNDLAWSYAFQDYDTGAVRASRLAGVVSALGRGARAGVAFHTLARHFFTANHELTVDYDREEEDLVEGRHPRVDPLRRAHKWMRRQDLLGYTLLGDPAARRSPP